MSTPLRVSELNVGGLELFLGGSFSKRDLLPPRRSWKTDAESEWEARDIHLRGFLRTKVSSRPRTQLGAAAVATSGRRRGPERGGRVPRRPPPRTRLLRSPSRALVHPAAPTPSTLRPCVLFTAAPPAAAGPPWARVAPQGRVARLLTEPRAGLPQSTGGPGAPPSPAPGARASAPASRLGVEAEGVPATSPAPNPAPNPAPSPAPSPLRPQSEPPSRPRPGAGGLGRCASSGRARTGGDLVPSRGRHGPCHSGTGFLRFFTS